MLLTNRREVMAILPLLKYRQIILGCSSILNGSRMVKRTAVDLAYKIHGNKTSGGMPVFTIHGLLGSKKNWESMSKKIASSLQTYVVAVDLRNHGESPHDSSHTYIDLAADVSKLISKLSIEKADVVGHSMGGRTAMVLALTEPSKVSHLVVVDISPISTPGILNNFFPRLIDVMKTIQFDGISNVVEARRHAKDKLVASGIVGPNDPTHFITMNISTRPNNVIGWNCNLDVLKEYFASISSFPSEMEGKSFSGPTFFIGGERSNYLPPEDINGIRSFFPKAELNHVRGVGHNVHAEDPNTFFNLVHEFLTKK